MAEDDVPPSRAALAEALALAEEILQNIELSQIPVSNAVLKASRLARLLNDFEHQKIFEYEAGGYPSSPGGVPPDVWALAKTAGRVILEEEEEKIGGTTKKTKVERCFTGSIADLEQSIKASEVVLSAPTENVFERRNALTAISTSRKRLSARIGFLHAYVNRRFYELKFSGIADDIFSRVRERVDRTIGAVVPDAVRKLSAIYDNLLSDNPEDWSNAVHGCRRLLQDLADAVYPARENRPASDGKPAIKLGPDNYINRLIAFIEEKSGSERFRAIVGSSLAFIGDRLDASFAAAQKGSHATIHDRSEADRYVVYTYMIVGDILSLLGEVEPSPEIREGADGIPELK